MSVELVQLSYKSLVIANYQEAGAELLRAAEAMVIEDASTRSVAVTQLGTVRGLQKNAEKARTELVKPHNDWVKNANDIFTNVMAPVRQADKVINDKILAYDQEQRRIADEAKRAQQRAEQEAQAARIRAEQAMQDAIAADKAKNWEQVDQSLAESAQADQVALEQKQVAAQIQIPQAQARTTVADDGTKMTVRRTWNYRVVDALKLNKNLLMVDHPACRQQVAFETRRIDKSDPAAVEKVKNAIPGLEIFIEETTSVRL